MQCLLKTTFAPILKSENNLDLCPAVIRYNKDYCRVVLLFFKVNFVRSLVNERTTTGYAHRN